MSFSTGPTLENVSLSEGQVKLVVQDQPRWGAFRSLPEEEEGSYVLVFSPKKQAAPALFLIGPCGAIRPIRIRDWSLFKPYLQVSSQARFLLSAQRFNTLIQANQNTREENQRAGDQVAYDCAEAIFSVKRSLQKLSQSALPDYFKQGQSYLAALTTRKKLIALPSLIFSCIKLSLTLMTARALATRPVFFMGALLALRASIVSMLPRSAPARFSELKNFSHSEPSISQQRQDQFEQLFNQMDLVAAGVLKRISLMTPKEQDRAYFVREHCESLRFVIQRWEHSKTEAGRGVSAFSAHFEAIMHNIRYLKANEGFDPELKKCFQSYCSSEMWSFHSTFAQYVGNNSDQETKRYQTTVRLTGWLPSSPAVYEASAVAAAAA